MLCHLPFQLQAPLAAARTATTATTESDLEEDAEDEDGDRNSPPPAGAGRPAPAHAARCAPPPAGPLPLAPVPRDPLRAIIASSREQTRDILHYLASQGQDRVDPDVQQRIDFGKYVTSSLRIMPDDIYHQASGAISDIVQAALRDVDKRRGQLQKNLLSRLPNQPPCKHPSSSHIHNSKLHPSSSSNSSLNLGLLLDSLLSRPRPDVATQPLAVAPQSSKYFSVGEPVM